MRRDVNVDPTGPEMLSGKIKTVAFNLSYTGERQDTVAMVTNDIANFYVAQNDAMRSGDAVKTSQFLKSQLEEAKRQLDVQEGRLRAYTSAHNGELPQQVDMNLATLDRLEHAAAAHQRAADQDARTAPADDGRHSGVRRRAAPVGVRFADRRLARGEEARSSASWSRDSRASIRT